MHEAILVDSSSAIKSANALRNKEEDDAVYAFDLSGQIIIPRLSVPILQTRSSRRSSSLAEHADSRGIEARA